MILYVCQKAQDMNIQAINNSVFITSDNNVLACLELYIVSVAVNFLSQVIFIFLLFWLHLLTLPYPKTKEKQKLPEMKN